jgi:hypothetical protein
MMKAQKSLVIRSLVFGLVTAGLLLGSAIVVYGPQQFTADKPGEYEYTHILMGRSTKAKVIVR